MLKKNLTFKNINIFLIIKIHFFNLLFIQGYLLYQKSDNKAFGN